jgi:hypothetical protein
MAETALVPVEKLDPVKIFVKRDIEWIKKTIENGVNEIINGATVETATGRQKIKSAAYQVARSKTLFDKMGKDFTAKLRAELNETNAGRKEIVDWCDEEQKRVRQPLTEWEEADKARQAKHELAIAEMRQLAVCDDADGPLNSDQLSYSLEILESFKMGDKWEEYEEEAAQVHAECIEKLKRHIELREKYEAEQAELERLRAEAEERRRLEEAERIERERKEREERIAREAAEKAQRDAEEKAKREREEAERREYAAIKSKEAVERAAKEAAEKAERERIAAEERARLEKEFAIKQERERAEKAEQERLAKEAAEKAEAEKKAANKRHRSIVNKQAAHGFIDQGMEQAQAEEIVEWISEGLIKNVTINY